MRPLLLLVAVLVLMAGCQETQHCAPGVYGRNCDQALMGQSDSGDRDGGMDGDLEDTGSDANVDAFVDPCAACTGDEVCYRGGDGGRAAGCVECVTRSDCDGSGVDAGMAGAFVCRDFSCVFGCDDDADCAGAACGPGGSCSAYGRAQGLCSPCDTDDNCSGGRRCASSASLGPATGYCLDVTTPCAMRVYRTAVSMPSIDDVVETFCLPPTTCEALGDAASQVCSGDDSCGADGVADGYCPLTGRPDPMVCSYRCSGNLDCFDGQVCEASAPRYCRSCIPADGCP